MTTVSIPPCQAACPICTDVRGYVAAIARGDAAEAISIIRRVNPLPSVCGRICTRLCESACRRAQVDKAISIRDLKRFATDQTRGAKTREKPEHAYEEKIAIVGSGPAGLTAAHDLALHGYTVTLFEAQKTLGGLLSEGIPDYRLPKDVVMEDIGNILALGVEAKTGVALGADFTIEKLLNEYQVVFLAMGSQKSLSPKVQGAELSGIMSGVVFLKQISRGEQPPLGKSVVVVGGGHTAIDAARSCIRLGCREVTIIYRRTLDEMPAGREEVMEAEREGVKMIYLTAPVDFIGDGKVERIRCVKMQLGAPDASGRRSPVPVHGSEFEINADVVILAIGYAPDAEILRDSGLDISRKGTVIVKDDSGITNLDGVFAAGDVVSGPQSVIEAMASGRKVAEAIHRHLRKLPHVEAGRPEPLPPLDERIIERIKKSERQMMSALPVDERTGNFREVDLGYSREQAAIEAQRCLNCGAGASVQDGCASCLQCVRVCPYGVPQPGKDVAEIDISQCQACGICAAECPASAILLGCEPKEDIRHALDSVMDIARQETPELLTIGLYCRYASPVGPPFDSDEVYWVGRFCTGRVNESHLIYPVEMGADSVIVSICGDNECRFRDGSRQMKEYILRAKRILRETGIGAERLSAISDEGEFSLFRKKIEALGVNPIRTGKKVES